VFLLRPITDANRKAVETLAVTPHQGRFVSGVRESILEAAEEPDAWALYWATSEGPGRCVSLAANAGVTNARIGTTSV
jgi:hypothetical protein